MLAVRTLIATTLRVIDWSCPLSYRLPPDIFFVLHSQTDRFRFLLSERGSEGRPFRTPLTLILYDVLVELDIAVDDELATIGPDAVDVVVFAVDCLGPSLGRRTV